MDRDRREVESKVEVLLLERGDELLKVVEIPDRDQNPIKIEEG